MDTWTSRGGAHLHVDVIGAGVPVVGLHGAYSASTELREALEPILAPLGRYRRIYPDVPGMGGSPTHGSIRTTNDVVDLLDEFIGAEVGDAAMLLVGHSYGGHLARGLAARRPDQVAGLALICPLMPATMNAEPHVVVEADGDAAQWLPPALVDEYCGYFVVHSAATARRFQRAVAPVLGRYDGDAVELMMTHSEVHPDPDGVPFGSPTLVMTGRHDSFVGWRDQVALLDRYPRATLVVAAEAGHALPHECPELVAERVRDWVARC